MNNTQVQDTQVQDDTAATELLDNDEQEAAALQPNTNTAIVCSMCSLPETPTHNFDKLKCPCKSTRYCNTTCQKKHWKEHRTECKRLIAEMKQKKTQKEANKNTAKTKPPQSNGGERKENKNVPTEPDPKKREEVDECPICLEELSKDIMQFIRMTCCGNGIHHHCAKDLFKTKGKMKYNCILCRAKTPNTQEENFNYLRPWVKKKKAWAMTAMAQMYKTGVGTRQNSEMARRLYELSAEKDDAAALCNLGEMYHYALGLPQSYAKAIRYYERAAELGLLQASYNLGGMYANAVGVERDFQKARELWTIAARTKHVECRKQAVDGLKQLDAANK